MLARDIMTQPVASVDETASLDEVARLMLDRHIGCVLVVDGDGRLTGIVTETDFTGRERGIPFSIYRLPTLLGRWIGPTGVEDIYRDARSRPVKEIMTSPVITAAEDEPVTDIVTRMINHNRRRLPVVRDGRPVGVVTRHDLLKLLVDQEHSAV